MKQQRQHQLNLETTDNLLIRAPNWVGDVVMAVPFYKCIRDNFPQARIYCSIREYAARILDGSPRGVSLVVGPSAEPVSDVFCDDEGILYAEVDLASCVEPKQFHDIAGGYNRFDIFQLHVDRTAHRAVAFADGDTNCYDRQANATEPSGQPEQDSADT